MVVPHSANSSYHMVLPAASWAAKGHEPAATVARQATKFGSLTRAQPRAARVGGPRPPRPPRPPAGAAEEDGAHPAENKPGEQLNTACRTRSTRATASPTAPATRSSCRTSCPQGAEG